MSVTLLIVMGSQHSQSWLDELAGRASSLSQLCKCTVYRVHHTIPTDSVPTDAIPTVHSRDVGWLTAVEWTYGQYRLERHRTKSKKNHGQYNNVLDAGLNCNFAGGGVT